MTLIAEQSVRSAITLMQKARQTLAVVVDRQVNYTKPAGRKLSNHTIATNQGVGGQGCGFDL